MIRALLVVFALFLLVWAFFYLYGGGELPFIGGTVGDAKTTASVKAMLALHRHVSTRNISVWTRHGVVTLTGEVAAADERRRIEELVESVDGVDRVENRLVVTPRVEPKKEESERTLGQRLDDATLTAKVEGAFALHRELKRLDISIRAHDGTVYLDGAVETPAQAEMARRWASAVEGVDRVESSLSYAAEHEPAQDVAARVEAALARNENLRAFSLHAVARGETIVLEGKVHTGAERELAELLAERLAKPRPLRNEISVAPR